MERLATKLPGLAFVLAVALTAWGFVRVESLVTELDVGLDSVIERVERLENNDRFLTCRALEIDAGRDPAACRYFLQGDAQQFLPPPSLRRPSNGQAPTVP